MTTNWDLVSKLLFPIVTAMIVAAISRRLDYKPKLVTYLAHAAGFYLPPVEGPAQPQRAASGPQLGASADGAAASIPAVAGQGGTNPAPVPNQAALSGSAAPAVQLHVHGIIVRNTGKKTAFNVRLGHKVPIQHYVLDPPVQHEKKESPTGGWEIVIPALVPNEQVMISYLYFPPITWHQVNSYTKSDEGGARFLNVLPTPQPPRWLVAGFVAFFYIGIAATVYAAISIAQWCIAISQILGPH